MLILKIKHGERVAIGDPQNPIGYVKALGSTDYAVRLGFEMPDDVTIARESLLDQCRDRGETFHRRGGRR